MGQSLNFPYYYGCEGEQYAFYRVPKLLISDDRFRYVSTDAKLLYGLTLKLPPCLLLLPCPCSGDAESPDFSISQEETE